MSQTLRAEIGDASSPPSDDLGGVREALEALERAGQEDCTNALSLMFVVVDALAQPPLP